MTKSILLVGVGGQGTILAAKLLTNGLMKAGYDVKMSEIHGMSQRGGSVSSHVRFGDTVHSPVIELGGADILVSFEKMEALRWLEYLKPNGHLVINDFEIPSLPMLIGKAEYPEDALSIMNEKVNQTIIIDALKIADEIGSSKVMNTVLLAVLIQSMSLEFIDWEEIIRENVKERFVEINIKALKRGMELRKD